MRVDKGGSSLNRNQMIQSIFSFKLKSFQIDKVVSLSKCPQTK